MFYSFKKNLFYQNFPHFQYFFAISDLTNHFFHHKQYHNYSGGASGVSPQTSNNPITELNKVIAYLSTIADNTKYNSAIPQIVELIGDSIEAIESINESKKPGKKSNTNASSEAENYQNNLENSITLMRSKLEAISKTL